VISREEACNVLRRMGRGADEHIDIGEAALALAALDRPGVRLGWYREHLADLAREVGEAAEAGPPTLAGRIKALQTVIAERYGYTGDALTYDDLQNANLIRVIDRRKGLPVALGILYIHAGRAQGWEIAGLNFPGHFLVGMSFAGQRAIIDPFNAGRTVNAAELRALLKQSVGEDAEIDPDYYEPVSTRDVLMRLQNNIKSRLIHQSEYEAATAVVESMLMFAPGCVSLWREAGILNARVGRVAAAIAALEEYLSKGGDGAARHEAAALLQRLRARLH
jgi:regulator of sirC expression with transglutaminase-like and TPR domain